MNSLSETRRLWLQRTIALSGLCLPGWGVAAHGHGKTLPVESFDDTTWARLLKEGPRPAAYVFTATYCSSCPAVFSTIHRTLTQRGGPPVELAAVVVNAQGAEALAHVHHYQGATRLYAFDGHEAKIRYAVDPKWRNITPYVVLLDRRGGLQRCTGQPSAEMLQAWLG